MTNKYKIALSCGRGMGIVKSSVKSWGDIVKLLSNHLESDDKESVGFFVGGEFSSEKRKDEFLVCRSMLTLDIDKYTGTIDDLEFDLDLLGSKEQHSKVECSPVEPVNLGQTQQQTFLPEVAKSDEYTREQLQSLCLEATKRNAANRDIIKAIMLSNFEARKTGDLADNQINLCYSMIAQATKDD